MAKRINYDGWSKEDLITELRRIKDIKYGLVWHRDLPEEKIDVLVNPDARTPNEMFPNELVGKPFPVLKQATDKAITGDETKPVNLLIEGDNYHSLAVLNFTHQEAVDLIYIDPPYNTGNDDFIYSDKIKSDYVKRDDPFRHSKWLAFMEKRLKLARNLLKPDGVIFISIDDNEFAQLKLLCDEVFEETNYIGNIIWFKKRKGSYLSKEMVHVTEYILAYKKSGSPAALFGGRPSEEESQPLVKRTSSRKLLQFPERTVRTKLPNGIYEKDDYGTGSSSVSLQNTITVKDGMITTKLLINGPFIWSQAMLDEQLSLGASVVINTRNLQPRVFRKYTEDHHKGLQSFIDGREFSATTDDAYENLRDIFGTDRPFEYSKPYKLIEYLVNSATANRKDAVILDYMAGSGTTGHAVLALNKQDGGNRKFILCTDNENNICSNICYPRLKKVIGGYTNLRGEDVAGLGGNLKYYTCDFVEAEPTDINKRKLVNESTDMLCIKENAFDLVQGGDDFKIFKKQGQYLGIVFDEDAIDDYKKSVKEIAGHFNTYVFSLGDDAHEKQFEDIKELVTLCAIPEVILKVYREIFR